MIQINLDRVDYILLSENKNRKTLNYFIPDKFCNIRKTLSMTVKEIQCKKIIHGPLVSREAFYSGHVAPTALLLRNKQ